MRGASRTAQIEGEVWLTNAIVLKTKAKNPMLPLFLTAIPSEPALTALSDKIARSKGFPVSSKITMTWRSARANTQEGTTTTTPTGASTTLVTDIKEISEEPLDDGLFKVPADYTKSASN